MVDKLSQVVSEVSNGASGITSAPSKSAPPRAVAVAGHQRAGFRRGGDQRLGRADDRLISQNTENSRSPMPCSKAAPKATEAVRPLKSTVAAMPAITPRQKTSSLTTSPTRPTCCAQCRHRGARAGEHGKGFLDVVAAAQCASWPSAARRPLAGGSARWRPAGVELAERGAPAGRDHAQHPPHLTWFRKITAASGSSRAASPRSTRHQPAQPDHAAKRQRLLKAGPPLEGNEQPGRGAAIHHCLLQRSGNDGSSDPLSFARRPTARWRVMGPVPGGAKPGGFSDIAPDESQFAKY